MPELDSDDVQVCQQGGQTHPDLSICCSTHKHWLCPHHYDRTHFNMVSPTYGLEHACNLRACPNSYPHVGHTHSANGQRWTCLGVIAPVAEPGPAEG